MPTLPSFPRSYESESESESKTAVGPGLSLDSLLRMHRVSGRLENWLEKQRRRGGQRGPVTRGAQIPSQGGPAPAAALLRGAAVADRRQEHSNKRRATRHASPFGLAQNHSLRARVPGPERARNASAGSHADDSQLPPTAATAPLPARSKRPPVLVRQQPHQRPRTGQSLPNQQASRSRTPARRPGSSNTAVRLVDWSPIGGGAVHPRARTLSFSLPRADQTRDHAGFVARRKSSNAPPPTLTWSSPRRQQQHNATVQRPQSVDVPPGLRSSQLLAGWRAERM